MVVRYTNIGGGSETTTTTVLSVSLRSPEDMRTMRPRCARPHYRSSRRYLHHLHPRAYTPHTHSHPPALITLRVKILKMAPLRFPKPINSCVMRSPPNPCPHPPTDIETQTEPVPLSPASRALRLSQHTDVATPTPPAKWPAATPANHTPGP